MLTLVQIGKQFAHCGISKLIVTRSVFKWVLFNKMNRAKKFSFLIDKRIDIFDSTKSKSYSKVELTGAPNFWLYTPCGLLRAAR